MHDVIGELVEQVAHRPATDSALGINFICESANVSAVLTESRVLHSLFARRTIWVMKDHRLPPDTHAFRRVFVFIGCVHSASSFIQKMQAGSRSRILVFWWCADGDSYWKQMSNFFSRCWVAGILNALVAVPLPKQESLAVYSYFPFRNPKRCFDTTPILVRQCAEPSECRGISSMFYQDKVKDLKECPLKVQVNNLYPYADLTEEPGQRYRLRGLLAELFDKVVYMMNFTPRYKLATYYGNFCSDKGIYGDIYNHVAHIGISVSTLLSTVQCPHFRPQVHIVTCYSWCMPKNHMRHSMWMYLVGEFSLGTWISVFLTTIAVALLIITLHRISIYETKTISVVHTILVGYVPQPLNVRSHIPSIRLFLLFWLLYNIVISTGYLAGLHGLNVAPDLYSFRTVAELADSDLTVVAPLQWYRFMLRLPDQEDHITKLVSRLKVANISTMHDEYFEFQRQGNRALLMPRELCVYFSTTQRSHEFFYFPDYCLTTTELFPFLLNDKSPFADTITLYGKRLLESGYNKKTMPSHMPAVRFQGQPPRPLSLFHLQPFMILLAAGCVIALIVFILELVIYKFAQ